MKIIIKCTDGIMTGKEWRFNGSGQIRKGKGQHGYNCTRR